MSPYLLIAAFIQIVWGLTPSASKVVLEYLPVEGYSAIRYTVSGIIFLLYTLSTQGRLRVRWAHLPKLSMIGILAYAIDSLGTLYGLQLGGVLNFSLASSMNAVITAGIAILILKERVTNRFAIAAGLSIMGGIVLCIGKYSVSGFNIAIGGLLLIWGAYVFEALGFVFSKKYKEHLPLTEYLGILQVSAGLFMWILCVGMGRLPVEILQMPMRGWLALTFVCLVSCCACYFVLYWLLNHVQGHKLAFFDCFHTIAATAFGIIFFSESFNALMAVGGCLLLAAVTIVGRKDQISNADNIRTDVG